MGYRRKPEKKIPTANWNKENFEDKKGKINYIGNINATLSSLKRAGKQIRRGATTESVNATGQKWQSEKQTNQIRKQVSIITGKPYISYWLRKENK